MTELRGDGSNPGAPRLPSAPLDHFSPILWLGNSRWKRSGTCAGPGAPGELHLNWAGLGCLIGTPNVHLKIWEQSGPLDTPVGPIEGCKGGKTFGAWSCRPAGRACVPVKTHIVLRTFQTSEELDAQLDLRGKLQLIYDQSNKATGGQMKGFRDSVPHFPRFHIVSFQDVSTL